MARSTSKVGIGFAIGLVAALLATLAARSRFVEPSSSRPTTGACARPRGRGPSDDIVLVSIDDDSVRRMAPLVGRWPWPRLVHASLIDFLARAPAKLIVYDVLFTEPDVRRFDVGEQEWTGAESDQAFVDVGQEGRQRVVAADAAAEGVDRPPGRCRSRPSAAGMRRIRSAGALCRASSARRAAVSGARRAPRALGHTLLIRDPDGPLRRHSRCACRRSVSPSLRWPRCWRDRRRGASQPASRLVPAARSLPRTDAGRDGDSRRSTRLVLRPVLLGAADCSRARSRKSIPAVFKDKIVVVGATASGTYEVQASPFEQGIAGGEMHANVIDACCASDRSSPLRTRHGAGDDVRRGAGRRGCWRAARVWTLAAAAACSSRASRGCSVRLFAAGIWMPLVDAARRRRPGVRRPAGVAVLRRGPGEAAGQAAVLALRPEGCLRPVDGRSRARRARRQAPDMTVLFSDVRGFTAMSEKATPEEVVGQLNEYFSRMVRRAVRAPRHARQVRWRHGDGPLRRAAGRSRPCRARGAGGAGDDRRARRAQSGLGGRGPAGPRHRHRHLDRRHGGRQHRIRTRS